jgi:NAD(P)-dependent dehydrogenase (short-subunit alcohol dehydrogenase family)
MAAMTLRAWNAAASFTVNLSNPLSLLLPNDSNESRPTQNREEGKQVATTNPVAIVTGVGPGTGAAIARRFAQGEYAVAMLARNRERLARLERELPGARAYPCDVTDETQLDATIEAVRTELGAPKVLIHNAVGGAFGNFMQIDPEVLNRNFQVNTMALLHLARRLAPAMVTAGKGAIIASGNTSALRGKAGFAGFAPTKAAQRILAESIARELGPKGVHVAYVLIDAVIDLEWTRKRWPDAPDAFFIKPAAIADEIWHVAHQDRSAWSFNVEIRPFGETW